MHTVVTNAWLYGVLIFLTLLALLSIVPLLLVGLVMNKPAAETLRLATWLYGRAYGILTKPIVPITINDPRALLKNGASIVVANHQSFLDIYVLAAQDAKNICLLVRSWPFKKLFFFGPLMRAAEYIETEGTTPDKILAKCKRELAAGNHVVGFPEGTRSPDGALGRFHSGTFKLAVETGVSVTPIIIHDSYTVIPKSARWFRPGKIHVEILPPVNPADFLHELIPHGAMRRHVRQLFAERLARGVLS